MAAPSLLGLPPVPAELRSISPYLQRAEELRQKEPIVAYWCAYYAAQIGIALKVKSTPAHDLLLELLGVLEKMKSGLKSNDMVDSEAASAAYVENFALRVFNAADDEERRGDATRATAKKLMAAANFLEVLKVFPKTEVSEANEEKIRYAKWKAADIAKAFREGRRPIPGPPGGVDVPPPSEAISNNLDASFPEPAASTSSASVSGSERTHSPPSRKQSSLPRLDESQLAPRTPPRLSHLSADAPGWSGRGDATPGSWSTAATPGTGSSPNPLSAFGSEFHPTAPESPSAGRRRSESIHRRNGSGSGSSTTSINAAAPRRSSLSKKTVSSEDPEPRPHSNGNANAVALGLGPGEGKKTVHFTPSVMGGLSSTDGSAPTTPGDDHGFMPFPAHLFPNGIPVLPTQGSPLGSQHPNYPITSSPPLVQPSAPPTAPSPPSLTHYRPPVVSSDKSSPPLGHPTQYSSPSPPAPVPDLTPAVIAKAQKHCRFAISALDYEDAETARKELRAALKVLEG